MQYVSEYSRQFGRYRYAHSEYQVVQYSGYQVEQQVDWIKLDQTKIFNETFLSILSWQNMDVCIP